MNSESPRTKFDKLLYRYFNSEWVWIVPALICCALIAFIIHTLMYPPPIPPCASYADSLVKNVPAHCLKFFLEGQ